VRLHHSFLSSSSWRVRIALALKGADYESVVIDFASGEHLKPEYRDIHPAHQVPSLEINENGTPRRITQSVAICEYLEERLPSPALFPEDIGHRAHVREIVELINAGIQPLHNGGLNRSLHRGFGASEEAITEWKLYWLRSRLESLERLVAGEAGECAFGDRVTLADVFLFPQLAKARDYDVDLAPFAALRRVEGGLAARVEFCETASE
jgi:maleylpyruvate isomerase